MCSLLILFMVSSWAQKWTSGDKAMHSRSSEGAKYRSDLLSKDPNGLVFIHVTSAPSHFSLRESLRRSWIGECLTSTGCQYRFYVDYAPNNSTESMDLERRLINEQRHYSDIVMRDSCSYMMERHPSYVNYSNAHVYNEKEARDGGATYVDYPLRKMYKIDWKMCFLKWAKKNGKIVSFHTFVEDDSYVCTGNLLHQLEKIRGKRRDLSFRTGFKLFDGFDDSSSIMSNDVASFFADHYLVDNAALNCSHIVASRDPQVLQRSTWLSWGNSWRRNLCNWRQILFDATGGSLNVTTPSMDCLQSVQLDLQPRDSINSLVFLVKDPAPSSRDGSGASALLRKKPLEVGTARDRLASQAVGSRGRERPHVNSARLTYSEQRDRQFYQDGNPLLDLPYTFPCHMNRPLVWHDHLAGQLLLHFNVSEGSRSKRHRREKLDHLCETTLIVDKVKEPGQIMRLWRATATLRNYQDFSDAFLSEDSGGWMRIIDAFESRQGLVGG